MSREIVPVLSIECIIDELVGLYVLLFEENGSIFELRDSSFQHGSLDLLHVLRPHRAKEARHSNVLNLHMAKLIVIDA